MTGFAPEDAVRVVLLDVEGTTAPVDFVHETLFSYARERAKDYLERHWCEEAFVEDLEMLREQYRSDRLHSETTWRTDSPAHDILGALAYIQTLIDKNSKCTPLKSLQGKIWQEGYATGQLRARLFSEVAGVMRRWHRERIAICIFSSGSVLAQRLLFANTEDGDLSEAIHRYFDTTTGKKNDPGSYHKIAASLGVPCEAILFVSDTTSELDAARTAGMQTALRPARTVDEESGDGHRVIHGLDEAVAGFDSTSPVDDSDSAMGQPSIDLLR